MSYADGVVLSQNYDMLGGGMGKSRGSKSSLKLHSFTNNSGFIVRVGLITLTTRFIKYITKGVIFFHHKRIVKWNHDNDKFLILNAKNHKQYWLLIAVSNP